MSIICTTGQLANGKDEVCDHLVKLMPNFSRGAFANAVKDTFCESFGVTRQFIEEWKRNPEPPPGFKINIRKGLQNIGDGFRQIIDDIWIQKAIKKDNQILSDGRYWNEALAVCKKNGINILVYRPGYINDDPNPSESEIRPIVEWFRDNHSEGPINLNNYYDFPNACQYYHYFLINDGDLNNLYRKVENQLFPYIKAKLK